MSVRNQKRLQEIYALLFLAFSLILLLALVSYHPADPSFNSFSTEPAPVENWIGPFGSYTADVIIRLLGLAAFLLPLVFFIISCKYFKYDDFVIYPTQGLYLAAFVTATAGLMALTTGEIVAYNARF